MASGAELQLLSARDAAILDAIAERITFTDDPAMPRFGGTTGLLSIDRALGQLSPDVVSDLHWALVLFEYGPPFFVLRFSTFTGLDDAGKDAYLTAWAESRIATCRFAFGAFKNLAMLGYYSDESTWKGIHYDGPWVPRPRRLAG